MGIATRGGSAVLKSTLDHVLQQTRRPDGVIVCGTSEADLESVRNAEWIESITAPPGLPIQRNAILKLAGEGDIVLFLDDDFLMAPDYVEITARAFEGNPDIAASTGDPIADGARGPGYTAEQALEMIQNDTGPRNDVVQPAPHGYGCNMAIRVAVAHAHGIEFDERLPLYAWSEDVDYTHRIGHHGRIVKLLGARGVHLGTKHGRTSGRRLGYSQVANPIYLYFKGSYSLGRAARSVLRNIAMNTAKSLRPEPYIDRRGRLVGNAMAFRDIVRGKLAPERILGI
jgi:GT2 family glycosyltransferase